MSAGIRPPAWMPPVPMPSRRETPRLVLRFYVPEDAGQVLTAIDEDRDSFLPWLPWVTVDNRTLPEAYYTIERFRRDRERAYPVPDNIAIGVFDRSSGEIVGGTGLHRIRPEILEAEIGYWVRPSRRRQGYCVEATAHLIDWALATQPEGGWGFRRIHIWAAAPNHASCRIPEVLGLPREAERRGDRWVDGYGWVDSIGWGITHEVWSERRDACLRARG